MMILKFISFLLCFVFVTSQANNNKKDLDKLINNIFGRNNASNFNNENRGIFLPENLPLPVPIPTMAPIPVPSDKPVFINGGKNRGNNEVVITGCGIGSVCVPYYLCKTNSSNNEFINKDGEGLLDIRFDADTPKECPFLEKCCPEKSKSDTPVIVPKPTQEGCGYRNTDGVGYRITGAKDNETEFGEFPWMVAVLKEERGLNQQLFFYQCGGSIIHPKVVLTAAHCVQNKPANTLKVRGGEWNTQSTNEILPHQDRGVAEVLIHEHFNKGGLHNDIALLILAKPFTFTDNVKSVCLPPPNTQFDYQRCIATGWGKDRFGLMGKYHVILRKIDLPIVPRDQCQAKLRTTRLSNFFELHPSFICAGGEFGKDTCKGDGGSPLVCPIAGTHNRYYQAGIVAWGIGCGDDIPGVYASVTYLRSWIDEKLAYKRINSASFTP